MNLLYPTVWIVTIDSKIDSVWSNEENAEKKVAQINEALGWARMNETLGCRRNFDICATPYDIMDRQESQDDLAFVEWIQTNNIKEL